MTATEDVLCCFFGDSLAEADSVLMAIYPTVDRKTSQGMYSHRSCLSERLHPSIPHTLTSKRRRQGSVERV